MELLRVSVILAACTCSIGAFIIAEKTMSPLETFTTTRQESAPEDDSGSFEIPRSLIDALKYHRAQFKRHVRNKKSVPSDPQLGCVALTEAREEPYMLCDDPSTIDTAVTSHTGRSGDADKVDKKGDEKIYKHGDGKWDKEGDGKIFSGLFSGSGAGLHTSVLPTTPPGYFGVQSANLGPAYGGVLPGFYGGGYPSGLSGGYALLNPVYTGCQQSPFYSGLSSRPYNHFVRPVRPIAPTSYFYNPVPSLPIAAPTVDVASHLYKHTTNSAASHEGLEQFSGKQHNQHAALSTNTIGPFMRNQFLATQDAIRHSPMNPFNTVAPPVGFGQFSMQPTNRYPFPAISEAGRQFPANVFNSVASHDASAQFSAQQEEAVRSQIGHGNSRTSLKQIDYPALPEIHNYLPTMQLPTGQSVRSSGQGLSVFPQRGDANCGGIPLLASCTPNVIVGKLIQNGHGGYGSGLGRYGTGLLNDVYASFGSGYSAPRFGGSPYESAYYRGSEYVSDSTEMLQHEETANKRVYTPLEKSAEPQKEPTKYEEKTEETSPINE